MRLATLTLGCKVNSYDTEAMQEIFLNNNYELVDFDSPSDVYLINTCTVTNLGDKKSRQMIRRAKKNNPGSIVIVTGCYAQVSPGEISKIEGVNLIIGAKDRNRIFELVNEYINNNKDNKPLIHVSDILHEKTFERLKVTGLKNRTRAYLKIQEGCDNFCSYCIIPFARGPVRSRGLLDILSEVKALAGNGFKEIVLTGIHVGSYGKDLVNENLLGVIKHVHEIDGIERIRLSSLEPGIITENFVNNIKNLSKVCAHAHLSLQSGCDKTLNAMNRKYDTEGYKKALYLLRSNIENVAVTTDIIAGFPGETEEDFWGSYNFCESMGFSKIHVFPFSPKKGTKAYAMEGQVAPGVKNLRAGLFSSLDKKLQLNFLTKNL
ncbi:MAG: tRNA (N(6)-L-threonylcarbamoyladenosine(37)-C(2))-methylthiotransferase MtaB, partial [Clostridiales bacterium]|nr:tRNA (N(6)-L-threonylcarbamoyladenosine(37)-C(2))-methylthiotransferase MtaB [Clostridiales bacterium]